MSNYNNICIRLKAIVLSIIICSTSIGLEGCSNKKEMVETTYSVENAIEKKDIIEYAPAIASFAKRKKDIEIKYYIDFNQLKDTPKVAIKTEDMIKMTDEELKKSNYNKDYVYPIRELKLTSESIIKNINSGYTTMTPRTFRQNNNIPIPNCYKWAENYFGIGFNENISTIKYSVQELEGIYGNEYVYYDFNITFNDVINVPNSKAFGLNEEQRNKYGMQKPIKKGDFLHYKALFIKRLDNEGNNYFELLANSYSGMGEDCDNIKNELKSNLDNVYKTISTIKDDKQSKTFNNKNELENYILNNNDDNKSKVKKKNN